MFSVIIPAKNESANIRRCITSVFQSVGNRSEVEVIVIDNGSSDETVELARGTGARVYSDESKHISGLRNLGAKLSKHELLAFLDADCEVLPDWIENAKKLLDEDGVGIVGEFPTVPKESTSWVEMTMYSTSPSRRRKVEYLGSCNMIMRKETFDAVGGFDESAVTGEDYILCQNVKKLGLDVIASPDLAVIHYGYPKTMLTFVRREIWHGLGMFDLVRVGRLSLPLIWSVVNILLMFVLLLAVFFGKNWICLFVLTCLLALPCGAILHQKAKTVKLTNFFKMYLLFLAYGFSRTISVFMIIFSRQQKMSV